jgi:hypothetical protein
MNCFKARNDFVSLWRQTLNPQRRLALLSHLRDCPGCNRSFRAFALTAPVLYSASEPESGAGLGKSANDGHSELSGTWSFTHFPAPVSGLGRLLPPLVMTAAALIAVYFAVSSRITFEDAIASDNANAELTSYAGVESLFVQESATPDTVTTSTEVTEN